MNSLRTRRTAFTTLVLLISSTLVFSGRVVARDDEICDLRADLAMGREDYPAAIRLHRNLLQSHPDNALMHYHLGFAYGMMGRKAEEINEYGTAVRLGLRTWDLFLNLGLAYLDQHQLLRAADALQTAVTMGPDHAEAHFNLAIAYEAEGRIVDAIREIRAAEHLAPKDPDIANMYAVICSEAGDVERAYQIWQYITHLAPDYKPAVINLALLDASRRFKKQPAGLREPSCGPAPVPDASGPGH
jgi:tetratricopeptide (TPR) repeat protein